MVKVPRIANATTSPSSEGASTAQRPVATVKSLWVAYALHLLGGGGFLGFHRFYLGFTRSAQIQLALGAVCLLLPLLIQSNRFQMFLIPPALIWYVVDLFLMPRMVRAATDAG